MCACASLSPCPSSSPIEMTPLTTPQFTDTTQRGFMLVELTPSSSTSRWLVTSDVRAPTYTLKWVQSS